MKEIYRSAAIRMFFGLMVLAPAARLIAEDAVRQKPCKLNRAVRVTMKYLSYLPKDYQQKPSWPLVLFLHGAGERGDDLDLVKTHGLPKLIAAGKEFPFIVVSPQCPSEHCWETFELTVLLDEIVQKYKVDRNRIYLTGMSMGGIGTWALAGRTPDRFAAIIPISGGDLLVPAQRIAHIPAWVFHGAKDPILSANAAKMIVEDLRNCGGKAKLTIYPEAGHDAWTETYANPEVYEWMLQQKRPPGKHEPKKSSSPR
jgi:predicted peptidase